MICKLMVVHWERKIWWFVFSTQSDPFNLVFFVIKNKSKFYEQDQIMIWKNHRLISDLHPFLLFSFVSTCLLSNSTSSNSMTTTTALALGLSRWKSLWMKSEVLISLLKERLPDSFGWNHEQKGGKYHSKWSRNPNDWSILWFGRESNWRNRKGERFFRPIQIQLSCCHLQSKRDKGVIRSGSTLQTSTGIWWRIISLIHAFWFSDNVSWGPFTSTNLHS